MKNKLNLYKGLTLGEGNKAISIEKINFENIYLRLQSGNQRRIIPTQLILDILPHLRSKRISIEDISRKYRSEHNLPHLFVELNLDYENFLLGYEATISKLCEYELTQNDNSFTNKLSFSPSILPKSFILLAGISGTGKTRFVREQAKYFKEDLSNYCLVSVRPDWHEPSDLLGYISRLGHKGARYITTDFLRFIVAAWKHITDNKDDIVPYWLCLDEMNLAPVEQYFADYLSIIETRYWDETGNYYCEALLTTGIFKQLDDAGLNELKNSLGLTAHDALWEEFKKTGIAIPPNLIVAGTVNMDETTHGFSRKVIDRAFTLDFGEFFPNNYQDYFQATSRPKPLGFPTLSQVTTDAIAHVSVDFDGRKSIAFLEAINGELKGTPFELAYRALNELLIAVVCFAPEDDLQLQAVWDDFLMTKALPRIEGDSEKLQNDGENSLLNKLKKILSVQFADIWADELTRPDLLRESCDGQTLPAIQCRSKKKLKWMQSRLTDNGFTSFWP
jgi:hypothetical protein